MSEINRVKDLGSSTCDLSLHKGTEVGGARGGLRLSDLAGGARMRSGPAHLNGTCYKV